MNYLVDTHAVIWFITNNERLPSHTKSLMEDKSNMCFVSIATYWEMSIKHSIGRLTLHTDLASIFQIIDESGFEILPITINHTLANANLDFHHQDPFDRIMIAQAITEQLQIITTDKEFSNYPVSVIWK